MATAFVDVVAVGNALESNFSSFGIQGGQVLTPSSKTGVPVGDAPSILVQYTPDPTRPSPLLLSEVKKAGQHKSDVRVTQKQGYFCHIEASLLVDLPPAQVYEIMTHPFNHDIFRAQKECTYRKVLSDDGVAMSVEVEHAAAWNFLFLSGTFHTRLAVEQSQLMGKISFHLLKSTVLHKFDGEWSLVGVLENELDTEPTHTLMRLRQDMLPTIIPPPPADRLFRRLLGKQIEVMFGEIKGEVENIKKGTPKLSYPPDQYVHINADPRPLTAALSRPRSRADLASSGGTASGTLTRPRSLLDLVTAGATPAGALPHSRSRLNVIHDETSTQGPIPVTAGGPAPVGLPHSRSRLNVIQDETSTQGPIPATDGVAVSAALPHSSSRLHMVQDSTGPQGVIPAAASNLPRRASLHAHMICLDQHDLAELGLELDLDVDMEDDEDNVMFYDCLDEVESFTMLVERAGSTGLHFEGSEAWLLRQPVSLEEEDAVFLDAEEELCADPRG